MQSTENLPTIENDCTFEHLLGGSSTAQAREAWTADLLDAANIVENERIGVWNINNGERFSTYAIKGERGSGMISLNCSAARCAQLGALVLVAAFAMVDEVERKAG